MRKLLFKLFLFFIMVWGIFATAIIAFPYYIYNNEYSLYTNTKQQTIRPHDVLIIGDSRAQAGILANTFSSDVYSLALPGGTAVEGYYVLDDYLKNNPAPKAVILSYSPYHFELGETFWERAVKYDFLSFSQGFEVIEQSVKTDDDITERGGGSAYPYLMYGKLALYKMKFPPYYSADMASALSQGKKNNRMNIEAEKTAAENKGQYFFGRSDAASLANQEAGRTAFIASLLIRTYFVKVLERCEQEGIDVYFFTAPMSDLSRDLMDERYTSGYQAMMAEIQASFPRAVLNTQFNYLPNDYFGDQSHVTEKGAVWFTEEIKQNTGIE